MQLTAPPLQSNIEAELTVYMSATRARAREENTGRERKGDNGVALLPKPESRAYVARETKTSIIKSDAFFHILPRVAATITAAIATQWQVLKCHLEGKKINK